MVCRCSAPADWRTNSVERIQIVTLLIRVQYLQTTRALTSLTSTGEIKPCEEIFSLFLCVCFFFNPPRPWLSLCRRSERCTSSCLTRCFRASIFCRVSPVARAQRHAHTVRIKGFRGGSVESSAAKVGRL